MKSLIRNVVIVLLLFGASAQAQINFLRGTSEIAAGNLLVLKNDLYLNTDVTNFSNQNLRSQIRFRYDDMKVLENSPAFNVTVNFSITKYDRNGALIAGNETGSLTIDYSGSTTGTLQEEQVYEGCQNAYKIEVQITSVTGTSFMTNDMILEAQMLYDRDAKFTPSAIPATVNHHEYWDKGEVDFYWSYLQGAESYELEWVFVSDEVTNQFVAGDIFKNATLVVTPNQHYKISVPYTKGKIHYRVRGVNKVIGSSIGKKWRSAWSNENIVYVQPTNSEQRVHETHESWSYTAMYSSNGLKSEQISYVDATGRVRQQIVKDESNGNLIIGEQKYGFNGEPSVQVLPSIIPDSKIGMSSLNKLGYNNNFTAHGGQPFDKLNFATDAKLTGGSDTLDANNKNYFSKENPFQGDGLHDYVASAEGYGYAQTMFDAQGRVTRVSGVGEKFHMGGGKEVEIWYGNAGQAELDRLFGNEVGYSSHYSKVMTKDANGVVSTSYYNLSGQLIATAIAGSKPSNLEDLDVVNYDKNIPLKDKLDNEYSAVNKNTVVNHDILCNTEQDYVFNYHLGRDWYESNCQTGSAYECKYILEVYLTDNQDNKIPLHITKGGNGNDTTYFVKHLSGNDFVLDGYTFSCTAHLKVGQYKVWKQLKVDPQGYEEALTAYKNFIINNGSSQCNIGTKQSYIDKYTNQYLEGLRCDPCEQGAADFTNAYFTYVKRDGHTNFTVEAALAADEWQNNLNWEQYEYSTELSAGQWNTVYQACLAKNCDGSLPYTISDSTAPQPSCAGMLGVMWNDLSPGGQYFDNAGVGESNDYDYVGSIPTDKNINPNDGWFSSNGINLNSIPSVVSPYKNTSDYWQIRKSWNSDAIDIVPISDSLLTYLSKHPEYCEYKYCTRTSAFQAYTNTLLKMTYAQASAQVTNPMDNSLIGIDPMKNENIGSLTGNSSLLIQNEPAATAGDETWQTFLSYYYTHVNEIPHGTFSNNCSFTTMHQLAHCLAEENAERSLNESNVDDKELVWEAYKRLYLSLRGKYLAAVKIQYKQSSECGNGLSLVTKFETSADVFNDKDNAPYKYTVTQSGKAKTFALRFPDFSLLQATNSTTLNNYISTVDTTSPYACLAERSLAKESSWFMGEAMMANFPQSGNPAINVLSLYNSNEQNLAYEGTATISDRNGNILYYSNGRKLWKAVYNTNGTYQPSAAPVEVSIPGGSLLAGNENGVSSGTSAVEGVMFVQHPSDTDKVYIFTVDDALTSSGNVKGFNYSELSVSAGTVTSPTCLLKDVNQLPIRVTEQMDATMHGNGKDIWITVRGSAQDGTANFQNLYSFKITQNGVETTPVVSTFTQLAIQSTDPGGNAYNGGAGESDRGSLKFSPNGKKAATVNQIDAFPNFDDAIVIYDFNNKTGQFTNAKSVAALWRGNSWNSDANGSYPVYRSNYDCEFSPNGEGLFVSSAASGSLNTAPLLWVNLDPSFTTAQDIYNNIQVVSNNAAYQGDIKIGQDGKLYQMVYGQQYLNVFSGDINYPVGNLSKTLRDIPKTAQRGFSNQLIAENTCSGDTVLITSAIPNCLCKQLLNYRNDFWIENYDVNADTIWNLQPSNEEAVSNLIADKYKKLYPTLTLSNGAVQSSQSIITPALVRTWEEGCLTDTLLAFQETIYPELLSECPKYDCYASAEKRAEEEGEKQWNLAVSDALFKFGEEYYDKCLRGSDVKEDFNMEYHSTEYQYTLYYYDLAGNLVATVYPEGVRPISDTNVLKQVTAYREKATGTPVYLADMHVVAQVNSFTYNTLGEVKTSHSVDAGDSKFYYDNLGRLIVSQNAEQSVTSAQGKIRYSYTNFDNLGRITETGEISVSTLTPFDDNIARERNTTTGITSYAGWLKLGSKSEVTQVKYDYNSTSSALQAELTAHGKNNGGKFNRNRISSVFFFENAPAATGNNYDNAYYYSYNEHGLAETFVQELVNLSGTAQRFKTINYDYDLFTGLVNKVEYQKGKEDQFFSKYEYDDLQRLKTTYTSTDGVLYNLESKNIFYLHGAKARIELAKHQVQGIDLAYTVRGQLKGMNSATLSARRDIGSDGQTASAGYYQGYAGAENGKYKTANKYFARDAAGFTLSYFKGDYKSTGVIHGQEMFDANVGTNNSGAAASAIKDLYNGSIAASATAIYNKDANLNLRKESQLSVYTYDVMYRLKEVQVFKNNEVLQSNNWQTAALSGSANKTESSYYFHATYDMNGNITSLQRNGVFKGTVNTAEMDKLTYSYKKQGTDLQSNRLYHVQDNVSGNSGGDYKGNAAVDNSDIENLNYFTYDKLGNIKKNRADGYEIEWTAARKVKKITRLNSSIAGANLEFKYDAFGRRICKIIKNRNTASTTTVNYVEVQPADWEYEYYALDASGNTLATYKHKLTVNTSCAAQDSSSAVYYFATPTGFTGGAFEHLTVNLNSAQGQESYNLNGAGQYHQGYQFRDDFVSMVNANNASNYIAIAANDICSSCALVKYKVAGTSGNSNNLTFQTNFNNAAITVLKSFSGGSASACASVTESKLINHLIYADSRLGVLNRNVTLTGNSVAATNIYTNTVGKRSYELVNWLGSVISVVSDMKYWTQDTVQGTKTLTSFEGGDENVFRSSWDAVYEKTTQEKYSGTYSLELSPKAGQLYGDFGPNVRELVNAGNTVKIDVKTLWHLSGGSGNRGGGLVYEIQDDFSNRLYDANHIEQWHELTVNDNDGVWSSRTSGTFTVPVLYNQDGSPYYGKATLLVYPWVANGLNTTYFDDLSVDIQRSNETEEFFVPKILSSSDYGDFGVELEGRGFNESTYDYGYQGSRKDNEIAGDENSYTTEFRQLDPRLGRWFSVDPLWTYYPYITPYASMFNDPINDNDPRGLGGPETKAEKVLDNEGAEQAYQRLSGGGKKFTRKQFAEVNADKFSYNEKTGYFEYKDKDGNKLPGLMKDGTVNVPLSPEEIKAKHENVQLPAAKKLTPEAKAVIIKKLQVKKEDEGLLDDFWDWLTTPRVGTSNGGGSGGGKVVKLGEKYINVNLDDLMNLFETYKKTQRASTQRNGGGKYKEKKNNLPTGKNAQEKEKQRLNQQVKETHGHQELIEYEFTMCKICLKQGDTTVVEPFPRDKFPNFKRTTNEHNQKHGGPNNWEEEVEIER